MPRWLSGCFLLVRTARGERKQHGLTIFLVPMTRPGIEVRPIRCMMGPHHLNEVFLTDVPVVARLLDVLANVDDGWLVVQEVLAFERVGIARYMPAVSVLLHVAPQATLGGECGRVAGRTEGSLGAHADALSTGPAYRCLPELWLSRGGGRVQPSDTAAYRIAVTKLDQDAAESIAGHRRRVICGTAEAEQSSAAQSRDHWRCSQASTVASGSIEMQRILLSRSILASA